MTFEFRVDREAHLRTLCEEMGKTPDDFINEAVLTFMEDYEDLRDGRAAYKEFLESGERGIPLREVVAKHGLEDSFDTEGGEGLVKAGPADSTTDQLVPVHQTSRAA